MNNLVEFQSNLRGIIYTDKVPDKDKTKNIEVATYLQKYLQVYKLDVNDPYNYLLYIILKMLIATSRPTYETAKIDHKLTDFIDKLESILRFNNLRNYLTHIYIDDIRPETPIIIPRNRLYITNLTQAGGGFDSFKIIKKIGLKKGLLTSNYSSYLIHTQDKINQYKFTTNDREYYDTYLRNKYRYQNIDENNVEFRIRLVSQKEKYIPDQYKDKIILQIDDSNDDKSKKYIKEWMYYKNLFNDNIIDIYMYGDILFNDYIGTYKLTRKYYNHYNIEKFPLDNKLYLLKQFFIFLKDLESKNLFIRNLEFKNIGYDSKKNKFVILNYDRTIANKEYIKNIIDTTKEIISVTGVFVPMCFYDKIDEKQYNLIHIGGLADVILSLFKNNFPLQNSLFNNITYILKNHTFIKDDIKTMDIWKSITLEISQDTGLADSKIKEDKIYFLILNILKDILQLDYDIINTNYNLDNYIQIIDKIIDNKKIQVGETFVGGSYKQKYLKYKQKYNKLRNELGNKLI